MTKQAQVGVFTIFAMLLLFGMYYVITDFGTRHLGYRVGVHFNSAAGLATGAVVSMSGVTIGSVDEIRLLPDNTVDVIIAVNRNIDIPTNSKFLIQAPLTGSISLIIIPPHPTPPGQPVLEREVLPVDQQPRGRDSATISDLLDQGQGEIRRLDNMLSDMEKREPRLLDTLQTTLDTANVTLARAGSNIVDLTGTLDKTMDANSGHIDSIMAQLDETAVSLNKATQSLQELADNKELKSSIIETASNIAETTKTIAGITHDLRTLTGNQQTQAQMRDTVANLDATTQRLSSLLGSLGGKSSVPGVDAGATPYPPVPYPSASPYPNISPGPHTRANPSEARAKLASIVKNLVSVQVRVSGLSRELACCANPVLSKDRGPQSDINAVLFEGGGTSLMIGANDIGYHSTMNLAALQRMSPHLRVGGGILYDQLGILGQYTTRSFGLESRIYDPRYPMIDLYGNFALAPGTRVFFGERDTTHTARRTVYGLQFQF